MMEKQVIPIITLLLFLVSCSEQELPPGKYVHWMEGKESTTLKAYAQGDLELNCQYMTPEYSVLKRRGPENLDPEGVQKDVEEISNMVEFKLKFERQDHGSFMRDLYTTEQQYNTRSMYLGYDIRYDLKLVSSGDTLPCALNHHERTYGNTPYETLLIAFQTEKEIKDQDMELIFNDRVFGFGRVKFFYTKEDLNAIPKLKI